MANTISQALIRSFKHNPNTSFSAFASEASLPRLVAFRGYSVPPKSPATVGINDDSNAAGDFEAMAVHKIENAIHQIMIIKSVPDWLPFVPGRSYWVPPKRTIKGLPMLLRKIANPLSEEEYLSMTNVRGWPSSTFYVLPEMKKTLKSKFGNLKSQVD